MSMCNHVNVMQVDQDPLGKQGKRLSQTKTESTTSSSDGTETVAAAAAEIWTRQLANHEWAILFFNRNTSAAIDITCDAACLRSMGLKSGGFTARDLNRHADVSITSTANAVDDDLSTTAAAGAAASEGVGQEEGSGGGGVGGSGSAGYVVSYVDVDVNAGGGGGGGSLGVKGLAKDDSVMMRLTPKAN
jgi:hypothetical protein